MITNIVTSEIQTAEYVNSAPEIFYRKNISGTCLSYPRFNLPPKLQFSLFLTHIFCFCPLTPSRSALGNCFVHLHPIFVPSPHPRSRRKLPYFAVWYEMLSIIFTLWAILKITATFRFVITE